MGMIQRIALFCALIGFIDCRSMRAQEVREVDGVKYIAHTVLKGQTLFAISKHYAVPIDAITTVNPAATQGLSLGQVLLIPVKAQVKKELKTAPALVNGELAHTVVKKETLYGIAKKYGVDQNDLVTRNHALADGVKEGMIVVLFANTVTRQEERFVGLIPYRECKHSPQMPEAIFAVFIVKVNYGLGVGFCIEFMATFL